LVCRNLESRFPNTNAGHSANLTFLLAATVVDYQTTLYLLLAAAGSVLIISSANVAGLQLIRVNERRREFMVQAALGASRRHLIQQLLTENLILSFIGRKNWARRVFRPTIAALKRFQERSFSVTKSDREWPSI
jgi:hypothetical protein